jgi:hypothetical protein
LPQVIAVVPEFVWELALGIYITVKGFKPGSDHLRQHRSGRGFISGVGSEPPSFGGQAAMASRLFGVVHEDGDLHPVSDVELGEQT